MAAVWDELAAGVFRTRYAALDLNIGVVVGEDGLLVVDTRASHVQARELRHDLDALSALPVSWVVNTHWHWDHTFGNALFADVPIHAHTRAYARLAADGENAKRDALSWLDDTHAAEIEEVEVTLPDVLFDERLSIDLGNRTVTMRYLGRGHTDNDIVMTVSDAPVLFAGDLLEESAPPYFGDGFPLSWPDTVGRLLELGAAVLVPGHGDVMTPAEAETQHDELGAVAAACASGLAAGGFEASDGPYPEDTMRAAWERANVESEGPQPPGSRYNVAPQ